MAGDDVLSWQKYLVTLGFTPGETGKFDDATVQATVDFQRLNSIPATGRADNLTFGTAMTKGLVVLPDEK